MKLYIKIHIFLVFIMCAFTLEAQQDTVSVADSAKVPIRYEMTKSPSGAVFRSLALPGWGQYYVESYWKIPLFSGGVLASAYFIIDYHKKYSDKVKEIESFLALDTANLNSYRHRLLKNQREFYRDNRDQAIFIMAGFYIAAAVDAYVGAHLFDFNVNENLSLNISPKSYHSISLNFELKIR